MKETQTNPATFPSFRNEELLRCLIYQSTTPTAFTLECQNTVVVTSFMNHDGEYNEKGRLLSRKLPFRIHFHREKLFSRRITAMMEMVGHVVVCGL
jgi:hypothetical protein